MKIHIHNKTAVHKGYASERTRGLYNCAPVDGAEFMLTAEIPTEDPEWQIGIVVGPSGSGKSSIGRALTEQGWTEWTGGNWPTDQSIIDVLGTDNYAKATAALAAVGLGSVPSWLRPHQVLSNGEAFRADLAALLLYDGDENDTWIDEFTSVLDRRVAQVGAGAFAKAWRKLKPAEDGTQRRVVLLTPHYDILQWVQPDWILDTAGSNQLGGGEATAETEPPDGPKLGRDAFPGELIGSIPIGTGKPSLYRREE